MFGRTELIAIVVAVALGVVSAWTAQEWRHGAKQARIEAAHASLLEQQAQAVVESVQAARNEEQRRFAELEKTSNEAIQIAAAARADADSRAASLLWLRERIDTLLADARSRHPALADGGPSTGAAIDMLAHMLDGALDVAGQLAEYADQARIAGLTCERSFDSLRK